MSTPSPLRDPQRGPSRDPLIGREIGRYRVDALLGVGGMGAVYRARDPRLGRDVALKMIAPALLGDADARRRLAQEARAAAALDHPHVGTVHDVGETDDGRFYIAMAFYDGETLRQTMGEGPLPVDEAVAMARQIASGLGAAHSVGIVHRDVKPENIMVLPGAMPDGGDCTKVLDFGVAKMEGSGTAQTSRSVGTAAYMAPEQHRMEPVDARTDVWALGVMLSEMLAGTRPFEGAYPAAIHFAILHQEPTPVQTLRPDVPDGLAAVIARCLEKDPAHRYASMAEVIDALDAVGSSGATPESISPPPTGSTGGLAVSARTPPVASASPSRARWILGALALLVLAAGAWFVLRPEGAASSGVQRLAVLPFDVSGTEERSLADGVVEAIAGHLAELPALYDAYRIIPPSEIPDGLSPSAAYDQLGATLVLTGRVRTEGDRVRVRVLLNEIGPGEATLRNSAEVDDASGSGFAIQDKAALAVADLLRVRIAPASRDALREGGTSDARANAYFLQGRGVLRNQQSIVDLTRARALFEEALALDPEFALARAGLAEAEWQSYRITQDPVWSDRAEANARRALAMDGGLAHVHTVLAMIHEGKGDLGLAMRALDRALEINPRDAEATRRLAKVYAGLGESEQAIAEFREAIRLAPEFWRPYNSFGVFYLREGRYEEAADVLRTGLDLDPANLSLLTNLGVAEWQRGDLAKAEEAFRRVYRLDDQQIIAVANLSAARFMAADYPAAIRYAEAAVSLQPSDAEAWAGLAEARWWAEGQRDQAREDYATALRLARENASRQRSASASLLTASLYAQLGQRDRARIHLRETERRLGSDTPSVGDAYRLAVTHELIGDRQRALLWLRSAYERNFGRAQAERSPWLSDLIASPAYRSLAS